MAFYQLGLIIRNRREELGMSQEDMADGICSVPTLSRIENGERMPTKNHYEMLMQRLGYSAMSPDFFTDKSEFRIHELKFKIRQAYVTGNYSVAKKHLAEFESSIGEGTQIDKQFLILYQILLDEAQYTNLQKQELYEQALRLTSPKYKDGRIPHILSYEEIILLNNIAICYHEEGKTEQACDMLFAIKDYYEHQIINSEEAIRTQPMVLYNLSKVLGMSGRYDECIEICDIGIRIARATGRCNALGGTLFNRGWAYMKRNYEGDADIAERSIKQAYSVAIAMEDRDEMEYLEDFYAENFKREIKMLL